jgi:hypothetical protein
MLPNDGMPNLLIKPLSVLERQQIVILTIIRSWQVREISGMNKQGSHIFHVERFGFRMLNKEEGKEQYSAAIPNTFAAFEDLDTKVLKCLGNRENIKSLGYYELKTNMP